MSKHVKSATQGKIKPLDGFKTLAEEAASWQRLIASDALSDRGWTEGPFVAKTQSTTSRGRSRSPRRSAAYGR